MCNESNQTSQIPFILKELENFIQMKTSLYKKQRESVQEKAEQMKDKF